MVEQQTNNSSNHTDIKEDDVYSTTNSTEDDEDYTSTSSSSITGTVSNHDTNGQIDGQIVTSIESPQDMQQKSEHPFIDPDDDYPDIDHPDIDHNENINKQDNDNNDNNNDEDDIDDDGNRSPINTQHRYSTFVNRHLITQIDDNYHHSDHDNIDKSLISQPLLNNTINNNKTENVQQKSSRVRFSDLPPKGNNNRNKRRKVGFNDENKYDRESDSNDSISSQEKDFLDDIFNDNKNHESDIDHNDDLLSTHSLHSNNMPKGRKSQFLGMGTVNFLQTDKLASNTYHKLAPKTPLPNHSENEIEFSHTASTVDFDRDLWHRVSDRSDTSDSDDSKDTLKSGKGHYFHNNNNKKGKKNKRGKKGNKSKRIVPTRTFDDDDEKNAYLDQFQNQVMNGNDDAFDEDDEQEEDNDDHDHNGYGEYSSNDMDGIDPDDVDEDDVDEIGAFEPLPLDSDGRDSSDSNDIDGYNDAQSVYSAYNKSKGDRMWFKHHIGHLKVLKKFFREMDKDKDGTISFDEFTKFLNKYGVNKRFEAEEIERFFLKITEMKFDPDNPNAIEDEMHNVISPVLRAHAENLVSHDDIKEEEKKLNNNNGLNVNRASKRPNTSFFWSAKREQPTGEVDMATFLFYFSSPIDSQAMNKNNDEIDAITEYTHNNTDRDTVINGDLQSMQQQYSMRSDISHISSFDPIYPNKTSAILPKEITRNKWNPTYSKAAHIAADKAKSKTSPKTNPIPANSKTSMGSKSANNMNENDRLDRKIDASLIRATNRGKHRHSLAANPYSNTKKLKKRQGNKIENKRGSISTLRSYHYNQRISRNQIRTSDDLDINPIKYGDLKQQKDQKQLSRNSNISKSSTVPRQEDIAKIGGLMGLTEMSSILTNENSNNQSIKKTKTQILMARSPPMSAMSKHSSINSPIPNSGINDGLFDKRFETTEQIEKLIKTMKRGIQCQDRKQNNNLLKNCFIGRDAVTYFLTKDYVNSRHGGLLLGRKLVQKEYIKYAGNEERDFEDEIMFFYQFTNKEDQEVTQKEKEKEKEEESFPSLVGGDDSYNDNDNDGILTEDSKSQTQQSIQLPLSNHDTTTTATTAADMGGGETPIPNSTLLEFTHSASHLTSIIGKMKDTIKRTSHRSNTLSSKDDIFSGKEIVDWLIANNFAKDESNAIAFGSFLRRQGFIRHIEFHPVFKNDDDEFFTICDTVFLKDEQNSGSSIANQPKLNYNGESNGSSISQIYGISPSKKKENHNSVILENKVNEINTNVNIMNERINNNRKKSNKTNNPNNNGNNNNHNNRTSLVLGQMGKGKIARGKKREKLVYELFSYIISSQIRTGKNETANMNQDTLLSLDMIVDGKEHPHIKKLLAKIYKYFKKCDEDSRNSLSKDQFNRFLIKCGVCLHSADLNVIFKVFDKNNTGLIDYDNFAQSALVHRVPGIKTENLTITHLIKHTISVNFGTAAGKKGADDTYTKVQMAISSAFEQINVSQTGAITLNEFKVACKKNDIEMYGGVTKIFQKISKNGQTITLPDFVEAFQGEFANRAEAPKLREVLDKLGMIQWTLVDNNSDGNNTGGGYTDINDDDEVSVVTAISNGTTKDTHRYLGGGDNTNPHHNNHVINSNITPMSQGPGSMRDDLNILNHIDEDGVANNGGKHHTMLQSPTNTLTNRIIRENTDDDDDIKRKSMSGGAISLIKKGNGGHSIMNSGDTLGLNDPEYEPTNSYDHSSNGEKGKTMIMGLDIDAGDVDDDDDNDDDETSRDRVPSVTATVEVKLPWKEVAGKVFNTFFKTTIIIALPGIILNSILHFLQAIPVGDTFPISDLTWFVFGFLVYLALQSTMVGVEQTQSLFLVYVIIASIVGSGLLIATIVGFALEDELLSGGNFEAIRGKGLIWWGGLFIVCLICECLARLKYMKFFGENRTKRQYCWYASSHAIGVSVFWLFQTAISVIVVSVSFATDPNDRWPIIIYCAFCMTLLRNLSLNTLGATFVAKLSDHFYLEDNETDGTDQDLLTQLSIISSYSTLWYLFTLTNDDDWKWVLIGIITYQLILFLMDITPKLREYIRPKMISLLKGELIAWISVGARVCMNFIYPFGLINNDLKNEFDNEWKPFIQNQFKSGWPMNLTWIAVYLSGIILLLTLLWIRIHRVWTWTQIDTYLGKVEFTLFSRRKTSNLSPKEIAANKQRNRLMVIVALTIGFVVSVTEAVSLWGDDFKIGGNLQIKRGTVRYQTMFEIFGDH